MADLVHHIRLDLFIKNDHQSNWYLCLRCFHDSSLPYGIQTMSIKLLLNLMDCVNSDKIEVELRRPLSMKILSILLRKYHRLAKVVEKSTSAVWSLWKEWKGFDVFWEDPLKSRVICSDSISADTGKDSIRDIKFILKTITAGVKSIILSFKTNYISFNPESTHLSILLMLSRILATLLWRNQDYSSKCSVKVLLVLTFAKVKFLPLMEPIRLVEMPLLWPSISAEDKELVDQFAYIFTLLDPYIFQDVLSSQMDYLFEKIVKNPVLLIIPQYFLAINTVSRNFAGIWLNFDG